MASRPARLIRREVIQVFIGYESDKIADRLRKPPATVRRNGR
jgi:hypothetical protein